MPVIAPNSSIGLSSDCRLYPEGISLLDVLTSDFLSLLAALPPHCWLVSPGPCLLLPNSRDCCLLSNGDAGSVLLFVETELKLCYVSLKDWLGELSRSPPRAPPPAPVCRLTWRPFVFWLRFSNSIMTFLMCDFLLTSSLLTPESSSFGSIWYKLIMI